jgi:H/ACA ribonucleoprotein complex subunit 3
MSDTLLRVCRGCGRYTMRTTCPACGGDTRTPHPARFSPEDRWGRYRRLLTDASAGAAAPPSLGR